MRKAIGKILKIGTLVSTWGLIAMVLLQIICRFSWFETPSWTEEASRILFIYAISFASGLALKSSNYYVALDAFYDRFGPKFKMFLDKSIPITIFLLFAVFAFYSIRFISLGIIEKSPSMGFNMGVSFCSMFIIGATLCYYAWHKIVKAFKRKDS
ncbi:TRAP transporter small permease [Maribacter sp. 2210JD10-5]|uniref:TRAP transporter small permease n=1 Tax=Maribacter sp. 2210JD10-5 TaxID=3386272 RepID=UPI0039BCD1EC